MLNDTTPATSPSPERQYYLDWLRILAFGLLVLYHVGMYYVSWDWHIKSPNPLSALEPWMRLVAPWRMDLLFLVSGAVTSIMLRRRGAEGRWLRERAARLLWPLLFGMLVIVPPQSYLEVVHRFAYAGNYLDFMALYLSHFSGFCDASGHCLILPTWNHLWYLPYLFVYTLLLWGVLRRSPHLLDRLARAIAPALAGLRLIIWPIVLLALARIALRARFPVTHALADDWFSHAQYFPMFIFGAVFGRATNLATRMDALRWKALACAMVAGAVMLVVSAQPGRLGGWASAGYAVVYSALQWCAIVAALGFAHRHLNFDASARRYFTEAVFPIYILHQTLTIVLAHTLLPWALAPALEAPLLVAGTFGFSILGFKCVRRTGWLRPMFGLRRIDAAKPGDSAHARHAAPARLSR